MKERAYTFHNRAGVRLGDNIVDSVIATVLPGAAGVDTVVDQPVETVIAEALGIRLLSVRLVRLPMASKA